MSIILFGGSPEEIEPETVLHDLEDTVEGSIWGYIKRRNVLFTVLPVVLVLMVIYSSWLSVVTRDPVMLLWKEGLGLGLSMLGGYTVLLALMQGGWWWAVTLGILLLAGLMLMIQTGDGPPVPFSQQALLLKPLFWAVGRLTLFPTMLVGPLLQYVRYKSFFNEVWEHPDTKAKILLGPAPWPATMLSLAWGEEPRVRGSVNCCEEFVFGWLGLDWALGVEQSFLEQVDYCPVSAEALTQAVAFMHTHLSQGHSVYVHCKGGVGRSTTCVVAYLATFAPEILCLPLGERAEAANKAICRLRPQAQSTCHKLPPLVAYICKL